MQGVVARSVFLLVFKISKKISQTTPNSKSFVQKYLRFLISPAFRAEKLPEVFLKILDE
jgi:hypothetical protein